MSYYVEYHPKEGKRYPTKRKQQAKTPRLAIMLLIAVVATYAIIQSGFLQYIIPGNPKQTAVAFSDMVQRVEAGTSVRESLLGFCEEIMKYES